MKIFVSHAQILLKWSDPWIYLGNDYVLLHKWERHIRGKRISLSIELQDTIQHYRPIFLEWLEKCRNANEDSLHWWMSHLAGRNNMVSKLFLYVCQIIALEEWLKRNKDNYKKLLLVCEDIHLARTVHQNLIPEYETHNTISFYVGILFDLLFWTLRTAYSWLHEIFYCWRHWRHAKRSCSIPIDIPGPPATLAVLLHQCLDDKAFQNDGRLVDRYFTVLPEWIEKRGYKVVRLPWLANVALPIKRIYQHLRRCNCLIIQDYLNFRDYFNAFKNHLKSCLAINTKIELPDIQISPLIIREQLEQSVNVGLVRFWLYEPALTRWCNSIKSLILIDPYEGMPPEHVQIKTLKERLSNFTAIGYYHVLISQGFMGYHYAKTAWQSLVMPDIVVTNGNLAKDILIRQGAPAERISEGPALRQRFDDEAHPTNTRKTLLILLALEMKCCVEAIMKIKDHSDWITTKLNVPVVLKPHPMMNRSALMAKLGWKNLPLGWEWADGEIHEVLPAAHCCIALGTAAVFDAVVAGCIVLPLNQELDMMGNYLDLLDSDFEVARAIPYELFRQRLEEIFITKREYFIEEFSKLRKRLIEGLNPVTDELLSKFLPIDLKEP